MCLCRLHDVIHADRRLYLVFEYLDLDLKKLMDGMPTFSSDHRLIKVSCIMCDPTLFSVLADASGCWSMHLLHRGPCDGVLDH
jgi:cyclin-dependent kinase 2